MENKIIKILNEIRPNFDFKKSNNFIEDGMLDSFDVINLVTILDADFGVFIDGMDILPENFSSSIKICQLLMKNGAKE